MTMTLIAVVLYLLAAGLIARGVARAEGSGGRLWLLPAVAAVLLHALVHLQAWRLAGGADMHFFPALSLVALGMALLTTLFGAGGRMQALGVVVYPLSALFLLLYATYGHVGSEPLGWRLQLHAWCALLAYATLAIAALLALMLWLQERTLRRREFHGWLRALPPLTELELLMFRTIGVGFVLLSATLLTGVLFVQDFSRHLEWKTTFSVLSWLAFGALLVGRWRHGWRGRTAVRWTLLAMLLLGVAFFGIKFFQDVPAAG